MVDNFEWLREVLEWDNIEGCFYPISIIQRSKDGHPFSQRILDHFYVDSLEKYAALQNRIREICIENNARAYINPGFKSKERVAAILLKRLADRFGSKNFEGLHKLYPSCVGECPQERKIWVLDCDTQEELDNVRLELRRCDIQYQVIPTQSAAHILVKPFDVRNFKSLAGKDVVKKNALTLLFKS